MLLPNMRSVRNTTRCAKPSTRRQQWTKAIAGAFIVFLCGSTGLSANATDSTRYQFNIPSLKVEQALSQLAEQAGHQLLFSSELVNAHNSTAVSGEHTINSALQQLLHSTPLTGNLTERGVIIITDASAPNHSHKGRGNMKANTNTTKRTLLAAMVGLFAAGGVAQSGVAQEVDESSGFMLEEVVVTASRRETGLNDTAISVAAIGGEEISRRNLTEMNDYLRAVPGVTFVDQGVGRNAVVMRGLALDPENEGNLSGPTVGVYLGEVSLGGLSSTGGNADLKMVDLERVEVLRGPQGTLFGSGSLGGAVRNIPNAPDLSEIGGSVKVGYSNTADNGGDNTVVEGVVNIPIVQDVLSVRALAYRHDNSGYIKNVAGTQLANNGPVAEFYTVEDAVGLYGGADLYQDKNGVGETTYEGGRVSVLWEPVEKFSATLMHVFQDAEQDGIPFVQQNTGGYTQVSMQFGDQAPGLAGKKEGLKDDIVITNLIFNVDLGWSNLMASSSWVEDESEYNYDVSTFLRGSPSASLILKNRELFSQEFRLVSQNDGPFQYILGMYYEEIDTKQPRSIHATDDLSMSLVTNPVDPTDPLIQTYLLLTDTEQLSFYGELSYEISDDLEITIGARRFDYERNSRDITEGRFSQDDVSGEFDESDTNTKVNLSYRPNDETLIYAQWAEGFRLGNVNFPIPKSICDVNNDNILDGTEAPIDVGFDSDSTENIEFGIKRSLLDERLQLNFAVYQVDWDNIPLRVAPGKLPEQEAQICFFSTVYNAATAVTKGIEFESSYQVTHAFKVNFGLGYTDAELAEDSLALGSSKGDRLPSSPEYSASLGLQYDFAVAEYPSYIRSDYAYVSDFYNLIGENGDKGGDYGQLNISAGISLEKFSLDLFVNNLTNDDSFTSVGNGFPDTRAWRLRPRTVGVNVSYQF